MTRTAMMTYRRFTQTSSTTSPARLSETSDDGGMGTIRKLIVQQWVTVENIAAEEDGGLSFVSGEPFAETTNKGFKASGMGSSTQSTR